MQIGSIGFWPNGISGQVVPHQPDPRTNPDWWRVQRMISDPHGYRIEQLEQEVKRLKARIAELEAPPYHGEWAAG